MKAHSHPNTIPVQRNVLEQKETHRTHNNISSYAFVSLPVFRKYSYKDESWLGYGDN